MLFRRGGREIYLRPEHGRLLWFNPAADTVGFIFIVTDWWLEMDQENILMPKLRISDGQNIVTAICWPSAAEVWPQTRLYAGLGPDTRTESLDKQIRLWSIIWMQLGVWIHDCYFGTLPLQCFSVFGFWVCFLFVCLNRSILLWILSMKSCVKNGAVLNWGSSVCIRDQKIVFLTWVPDKVMCKPLWHFFKLHFACRVDAASRKSVLQI